MRFHALDFAVLAAQIMDEDFAGGGQPHAARTAVEQGCAEFVLQIGDPAIDRRGGDVEPVGGFADRPGAGDLVDIVQNPQMLHGYPSFAGGAFSAPL